MLRYMMMQALAIVGRAKNCKSGFTVKLPSLAIKTQSLHSHMANKISKRPSHSTKTIWTQDQDPIPVKRYPYSPR